jgi:hypothetical protein
VERADAFADRLVRLEPSAPDALHVVASAPRRTIAELERELERMMLPTNAELERTIVRQGRQVDEMRKKRRERESDERVATLTEQ